MTVWGCPEHGGIALKLRMVGRRAVYGSPDVGLREESAGALARDAHGHVHKNAVEGLQLCRPSSCVPFLAFHNPSVLSEHAEVEAVVNVVDPYERRVARSRRQLVAVFHDLG